jgi:antitoxin component YwqK of YwqJK toxin-antitoxin module
MQGYIADGDHKSYVGDVFWFGPEGEDSSGYSFINKTQQKKLTYYFDDGKIWKTIEYGDSLKAGKTIEYKPDGTILGKLFIKTAFLNPEQWDFRFQRIPQIQ